MSRFASPSKFNIVSIATQMLTQRMSDPFSVFAFCITIDAMLNFDGDVDADVKSEQSTTIHLDVFALHPNKRGSTCGYCSSSNETQSGI